MMKTHNRGVGDSDYSTHLVLEMRTAEYRKTYLCGYHDENQCVDVQNYILMSACSVINA